MSNPIKHKEHPKQEHKKDKDYFNAVRKAKLPIDFVKEIPVLTNECPECSVKLHSRGSAEQKIQEITIKRKVILFRLEKKQCPECGYFEMSEVDKEFQGSSYGPDLRSWISVLHYRHRLTEPQILEFLDSIGIVISASEINHILLENGKTLEPISEHILESALKRSTYANLDESGWKTKGVRKYIWTVCNDFFSYFQIHHRRNSEVANELVKSNKDIFSVTDDYSCYGEKFKIENKQLCWIHEIRHYEKLLPFTKFNQKILSDKLTELWTFYFELQEYRKNPKKAEKKKLFKKFDEITSTETQYAQLNERLQLTKKKKERLLVCLDFPEVPPENNCAERALRHAVVIRKISRGSRCELGESALTAHLTFLETCKKLGYNVKEQLKNVLLNNSSINWSFAFA